MAYKVEFVEEAFGKGVKIEEAGRSYEQYNCRDGLVARISIVSTTGGIIFKPKFRDTKQDYGQFKTLVERLENVTGEEIPHEESDFVKYLSNGLSHKFSKKGLSVRINLNDRALYSSDIDSWLKIQSYKGGAVTDLITYIGGFLGLAYAGAPVPGYFLHGIFTPLAEALLGMLVLMGTLGPDERWCGPLHAPGFFLSRYINKKRLKDSVYFLKKFVENHEKLEKMKKCVGKHRQYSRLTKKRDVYFGLIRDTFHEIDVQKGFSISYNNNRQDIIDLFGYLLEGGDVPKFSGAKSAEIKIPLEKKLEEKVEEKPVEKEKLTFINPFEVDIPGLGGKK